jgi:hypothetical protein
MLMTLVDFLIPQQILKPLIGQPSVSPMSFQDGFALHYQNKKFASIIFEFIHVPHAAPYLKKYIKDNGNLVHVGAGLFETIESIQVGQRCFVLSNDEGHQPNITIVPQGEKFSIDPILQKYLQAITKNSKFQMHEIKATDALKQRAEVFHGMHNELAKKAPYFPDGFVMAVLLAAPDKTPITAGQLRKMTETYSPGWLRRHVSGKTQGMVELEKFLSQYKDDQVLQEGDLGPLLAIVQNRQCRVSNSKNPTRNAQGSTTQVYKQIAVAIMNFWLSSFAGVSAAPAPEEKRDLQL